MSMSSGNRGRLKLLWDSTATENSLRAKVFRGGAWLGSGSFAEQAARFGRNMLLTRLLAPEAFGTMAVVMSATSVLASIMDVGAREALIQNPKGSQDGHVGAAWWLAFGRSMSLYVLLFFTAPFAAHFYNNSELSPLLRVAGASLIFEGIMSARAYVAIKEMKFRKWAAINHGGGITGVIVTVILAFFIRDVWALVLGSVAEGAARSAYSYILCPFVPPLRWDGAAIRELWHFSKGVFGLAILNLIFIRTDIFVLAKLYSAAALGLYAMAIYVVQTPTGFLMNLLGQTLMPTYAHVQDDHQRMNRILLQVTAALFLIGMPGLLLIFFCAHPLLTVLYGSRYGAAAGALTLAACVALLNLANAQITTIFYAKGVPGLHRRCVAIMAVMMIVLIYPFAKWFGILGGQYACLLSIAVGYLFQIERIRKVSGLDLSRYKNSLLISGGICVGVFAACLAAREFGGLTQPFANVAIGVLGTLIAYGIAYMVVFGGTRSRMESVLGL